MRDKSSHRAAYREQRHVTGREHGHATGAGAEQQVPIEAKDGRRHQEGLHVNLTSMALPPGPRLAAFDVVELATRLVEIRGAARLSRSPRWRTCARVVTANPSYAPAHAALATTYAYLAYLFPIEGGYAVPLDQAEPGCGWRHSRHWSSTRSSPTRQAAMRHVHAFDRDWAKRRGVVPSRARAEPEPGHDAYRLRAHDTAARGQAERGDAAARNGAAGSSLVSRRAPSTGQRAEEGHRVWARLFRPSDARLLRSLPAATARSPGNPDDSLSVPRTTCVCTTRSASVARSSMAPTRRGLSADSTCHARSVTPTVSALPESTTRRSERDSSSRRRAVSR